MEGKTIQVVETKEVETKAEENPTGLATDRCLEAPGRGIDPQQRLLWSPRAVLVRTREVVDPKEPRLPSAPDARHAAFPMVVAPTAPRPAGL